MLDVLNHLDRVGKKTLSEGIVDEEIRHGHQMRSARTFRLATFGTREVIRIASWRVVVSKTAYIPVLPPRRCRGEGALQICCHSVVINQRVVYVEQETNDARRSNCRVCSFSVGQATVPLIADMRRVCYAKMQQQHPTCHFLPVCNLSCKRTMRRKRSPDRRRQTTSDSEIGSARRRHRMMCYFKNENKPHHCEIWPIESEKDRARRIDEKLSVGNTNRS